MNNMDGMEEADLRTYLYKIELLALRTNGFEYNGAGVYQRVQMLQQFCLLGKTFNANK